MTESEKFAKQLTCEKFNLTPKEFDESLAAMAEWETWESSPKFPMKHTYRTRCQHNIWK